MLLTGVIIKASNAVLFGLASWMYKPPIDSNDDEAEGRTNPGFEEEGNI